MASKTLLAILTTGVSLSGTGAQQEAAPALRIVQPTAESVVNGRVLLEADVALDVPAVRAVTFFVDGQPVCRRTERPYQCEWEAGDSPAPRNLRVTAELGDGRRLVQTLRTATRPASAAFRAAAHMVLVPVHVTDRRGQFVRGLSAEDFRVYEDRIVQRVELVKTGESPASVLLALDVSSSMAPSQKELTGAAAGFLRALGPDDAITITAFNEELHVLLRSGATPSARLEALDRLRPSGGTALYDGIIRAVDIVSVLPPPRAIVVFTDGEDTRSRSLVSSVRTTLQRNDVVLYLVAQSASGTASPLREYLAPLASETGGMAWFPTRMSGVVDHFLEIVGNLRNQYVLAYAPTRPPTDGGWRSISVTLTDDRGYRVRNREGYMGGAPTGAGR